jgi:hypothetical protein
MDVRENLLCTGHRKGDIDCPYRAFGGTEATFFTKIIFYMCRFIPERYRFRWAHFDTLSASGACIFINEGYHYITIPRRYPS